MGITHSFYGPSYPFYSGTVSVAGEGVPGAMVSIGDHSYLVDRKSDRYRFVSIPALRPQTDTEPTSGEHTLTVDGLWRKIISTWHHGAGQTWFDRNDADGQRFDTSRGVNPWERWELTLLPDVTEVEDDVNGFTSLAVGEFTAGQRLVAVGTNTGFTVTPALGLTTISGLTGTLWCTSNGSTVYVAASDGIYTLNAAGTGGTMWNTNVNAANRIAMVKGRLIATVGAQLWDVIDTTTSTPHYTQPWPGWAWTGLAEGQNTIYACGYAGDKGLIYSVPIKDDGTGLDAPRVAQELPHGELPYAMVGYIGFLVIGTSKGVRLAQQDVNGNLTLGAVVGEEPCRCLEPQDRFVWFGWDNIFSSASGLGRLDLSEFVQPLAPAYASDLVAPEAGNCTAVITFDDKRFFVAGTGLYTESANAVGTGYFTSGNITFNIADDKVAVYASVRHSPLETGEQIELEEEVGLTGVYTFIGESVLVGSTKPPAPFRRDHERALAHQMKVTLRKGTPASGPVLTGVELAAQPAPVRSFNIFLPLLIASPLVVEGYESIMDVPAEVHYLRSLVESQQLVRFSSGVVTHLVFVEDYEWIPGHLLVDETHYQGTMVVKLKFAELTL